MERNRVIVLGTAYVEARINSSDIHLPKRRSQLPAFLDTHAEAELYSGGSIPNIATSFVRLSDSVNVRLFCCVGKDERGRFFTENIDARLGKPKTSRRKLTGVWVGIYNNGLTESFDFYGAADSLRISRRELRKVKNEIFISDVDFLSTPHTLRQVQKTLKRVSKDHGIFALSLGHAGHNPKPTDQEHVKNVLLSLSKHPEVVFGNEYELSYITGKKNLNEAMATAFPQTELVVITRGESGALIRFGKKTFSVPADPVQAKDIVDVTGAGDTFMGSALAILNRTTYTRWSESDMAHAMRVANYAASLVIQSMNSHLTHDMKQSVLDYEKTLKAN